MAITFGTAEFAVVKKRNDTLGKIDMPDVLPPFKPNPLCILSEQQRENCFGTLRPMSTIFNRQLGTWETSISPFHNNQIGQPIFLQGDNFIVNENGIHNKKDGGSIGKKISNITLSIFKIERRWSGKTINEIYHVKINFHYKNGASEKTIKIKAKEYKKLFDVIREELPSAYTSIGDYNAKEEYLTEVYNRDEKTAEIEYHSAFNGWVDAFPEIPPKFYVGEDIFYSGMEIEIPFVNHLNRRDVFTKGFNFLEIGHGNAVIYLLWIAAHISLSLFWLRKYGVDFRSVIFLKGKTNLFKTTVVSLLANIFAKNRRKTNARLSSTPAYSQEFVTKMRDSLVLLDDFSNTVGSNNNKARDNAETAIRTIGDGIFSGKMNVNNLSEGRADDVQCVLTITGEDELNLDESSLYRLIILPITEGTFDKKTLNIYREKREQHDFLKQYFALFVLFLTDYGFSVVKECASRFAQYCSFYSSKFSVPRFIDAATTMSIEIDLIVEFAKYCGMTDSEIEVFREQALHSITEIITNNLKNSKEAKPELRFLIALMQSIGTEKFNGLAENEAEYIANISNFIGFKEEKTSTLWLRFDDAYNLVKKFYQRQNEQFLTSAKTIKELLLQKKLSDGKLAQDGQGSNEYLKKSKKEPRKFFLVLKIDAVEKYLDENKEEL